MRAWFKKYCCGCCWVDEPLTSATNTTSDKDTPSPPPVDVKMEELTTIVTTSDRDLPPPPPADVKMEELTTSDKVITSLSPPLDTKLEPSTIVSVTEIETDSDDDFEHV